MRIAAERTIAAQPETVWQALHDPECLKRSIPGCESLVRTEDGRYQGNAVLGIGPIQGRFSGLLALRDEDFPNGYRIAGELQGGRAGFANGEGTIRLEGDGGGTRLSWDIEATIGGKLAQMGTRIIDAAVRKLSDDFFARLDSEIAARPGGTPPLATAKLAPAIWVPALIALVAGLLYVFSVL